MKIDNQLSENNKNFEPNFTIVINTIDSNKILSVKENTGLLKNNKILIHKYTLQKKTFQNGKIFWKDEDVRNETYTYMKNDNIRCKISYFIGSEFKISYTKNYTEVKPFLNKVSIKKFQN